MRLCTRTSCTRPAVATLTYVYAESTVVVGPLSSDRIPGALDLCPDHAEGLGVPRGWEIIRLPLEEHHQAVVADDDLMALAAAVRSIGLRHDDVAPLPGPDPTPVRRLGHLRLLPTLEQ